MSDMNKQAVELTEKELKGIAGGGGIDISCADSAKTSSIPKNPAQPTTAK